VSVKLTVVFAVPVCWTRSARTRGIFAPYQEVAVVLYVTLTVSPAVVTLAVPNAPALYNVPAVLL
jgi:hypothetical protein